MDGATGAPNPDQTTIEGFSVSPLPQYSDGTSFPANFLSHETVIGYENDRPPTNDGADDVLIIIFLLEKAGLRCCILDVMALQYYGSERVRNDWWICVPSAAVPKAAELIGTKPEHYIPFAPDVRCSLECPERKWPRFKAIGLQLFFLLVPTDEAHFAIEQEGAIVRGKTGLPFPSLPAFVLSQLDNSSIRSYADLADLVDAMDLSEEWAAANGVKVSDEPYPRARNSPRTRWERITRTKQKRMGRKYDPKIFATSSHNQHAAWDRRSANSIFPISKSDVLRINKDPNTALTAPLDWGFGEAAYMVEIDVFHQIHRLNALRKASIPKYDHYYRSRYSLEPPLMFQTHLGHCTDIILQNLMCHADVEVITHAWQEDQNSPFPDFGISKQRRDFESLLEWKEENELEGMKEKYLDYEKPPHAIQLPREPGMADLGNGTGFKNGVVTGPIHVNVCSYSQD